MTMANTQQLQAIQLAEQINDEFLTCKICFEHYKEPKCLSCLHTFCEECIEQHVSAQRSYKYTDYREFSCPICRKKTVIPTGGVRKLNDNFLVSSLNELLLSKKPSKVPCCDICKIVAQREREATSKCVECQKLMCRSCVQAHQQMKITVNHSVYELEIEKDIMCKQHPNEQVRFYCEACELCVCVPCTYTGEHRDHDLVDFRQGIAHHKDKIEDNLRRCRHKIADIRTRLDVLRQCETHMASAQAEIHTVALGFIEAIRARERTLCAELRALYGDDTLAYIKKRDDLETFLDQLKSTCNLTEMVVQGKDIEMLLLKKQLCEKFDEFQGIQLDAVPENIFKKICFIPGSIDLGQIAEVGAAASTAAAAAASAAAAAAQSLDDDSLLTNGSASTTGELARHKANGHTTTTTTTPGSRGSKRNRFLKSATGTNGNGIAANISAKYSSFESNTDNENNTMDSKSQTIDDSVDDLDDNDNDNDDEDEDENENKDKDADADVEEQELEDEHDHEAAEQNGRQDASDRRVRRDAKNADATITATQDKTTQIGHRDAREIRGEHVRETEVQTDIRMIHDLVAPSKFERMKSSSGASTLAARTDSKSVQTDPPASTALDTTTAQATLATTAATAPAVAAAPAAAAQHHPPPLSSQSSLEEDANAPVDRNKLGRRVRRHVRPGCSIAVLPNSEIIIIDPEANCVSVLDRRGKFRYGMSNSNRPATEAGNQPPTPQFAGTISFAHLARLERGARIMTPQGTLIIKLENEQPVTASASAAAAAAPVAALAPAPTSASTSAAAGGVTAPTAAATLSETTSTSSITTTTPRDTPLSCSSDDASNNTTSAESHDN